MPISSMTFEYTPLLDPPRLTGAFDALMSVTFNPFSAHDAAATRPLMPPPTTTTSVSTVSVTRSRR